MPLLDIKPYFSEVDKVIVGADRITKDARLQQDRDLHPRSPSEGSRNPILRRSSYFSSFDLERSEKDGEIEERDAGEIRRMGERQLAPPEVEVYNPAFGAMPLELVTAITPEQGIYRPPEMPDLG